MPTVQTTYSKFHAPAYAGMIADQEMRNLLSRIVEDAAGIGFGRPVFQGVGDHGVTGIGTSRFIGFTVLTKLLNAEAAALTTEVYPQNYSAVIMATGPIYVTVSGIVTAGAAVTYDSTTGNVSAAAVGGNQTAIPNAYFDISAPSGGLAIVRVR